MLFGLGKDYIREGYSLVDNVFLSEYMPDAPEIAVKVYLYGQLLQGSGEQNTVDNICAVLDITFEELTSALDYWEELGLLEYLDRRNLSVRLRSCKSVTKGTAKFKTDKYSDFNQNIQGLFPDRMIPPYEYVRYYEFIETYKMEPDALFLIASYCVTQKTTKVRCAYILAVAKAWVNEGVRKVDDVERRLEENEAVTDSVKRVMRLLKLKSLPDMDDVELYKKWTSAWGYDHALIETAATLMKRGNMSKLDEKLDGYFKLGITTADEMRASDELHEKMLSVAKEVCSILTKRYGDYEQIIEVYIVKWLQNGYDGSGLSEIARHLFSIGIYSLPSMDEEVDRLYSLGYVTLPAIKQYYKLQLERKALVNAVVRQLGSERSAGAIERESYTVWTEKWGFSHDAILAAAELARERSTSISYLNNLLATLKQRGKFSVEDIRASKELVAAYQKPTTQIIETAYTEEESTELRDRLSNFDGDIE